MASDGPLKIGDLARKTGKSLRALRLYEELGLLRAERSSGGFRLYGVDQIARVYWIAKLQDMGFTLPQIQGLIQTVESSASGPDAMLNLREMFRGRLAATRAQVERLLQLERDLSESLAYLEGCRGCTEHHDVGNCAECGSVHAEEPTPSLVAGVHLSAARPRGRSDAPGAT
jgi:DNA-binding transcriptional MerR regulator